MNDAAMIGIFGRRGSGKTTLAKAKLKGADRVVIFDAMHEYTNEPGFTVAASLTEALEAIRKGWAEGFKVAYQVPVYVDRARALSDLSAMLMQVQQPYKDGGESRQIWLVVEEMSLSVPTHGLPLDAVAFLHLCTLGRHYGINVIGLSQRPAQVNADFRGNCLERYFFSLEEHTDLTTVIKMIGPDYKAQLQGLEDHEYLKLYQGTVTRGKNSLKT